MACTHPARPVHRITTEYTVRQARHGAGSTARLRSRPTQSSSSRRLSLRPRLGRQSLQATMYRLGCVPLPHPLHPRDSHRPSKFAPPFDREVWFHSHAKTSVDSSTCIMKQTLKLQALLGALLAVLLVHGVERQRRQRLRRGGEPAIQLGLLGVRRLLGRHAVREQQRAHTR